MSGRAAIGIAGVLAAAFASGCPRRVAVVGGDAGDAGASAAIDPNGALATIARAEDRRRAKDVGDDLRGSHDVVVRRRAARALARIADDASIAGLVRALEDEDAETIAWGAYGLGATCRGHEDGHVRALAGRAVSLASDAVVPAIGDVRAVIARALGKCGGEVAEKTLASWLKQGPAATREAAAYALGDVASKRNRLGDETTTALLDAAKGAPGEAPIDAALYPFGRIDAIADAFVERLLAVGRAALAAPPPAPPAISPRRLFAIRALARAGDLTVSDLIHVVEDKSYLASERAEAARGLGRLGRDGRSGAADALVYLVPERDPVAIAALAGDDFGVMTTLLAALGGEPPKKADKTLSALANLVSPQSPSTPPSPSLARRVATLRCTAAGLLARGSFEADVLRKCADGSTDASERARLAAIVHRHPMDKERRAAWLSLARSKNARVREAALEAIGAHPELKDAARAALAEALASEQPGLVATAAEQIHAHPERVYVLAQSEIRAALDPNNRVEPSANPARELDAATARAMKAALAHPWSEDLVETKVALLDAALAVGLKEGRDAATAACRDPNATMRARAKKALATFPDADAPCAALDAPPDPTPEIAAPLARATTVRFDTDAGPLAIRFDPSLAPIAVTRMVALAKSGFYTNVVVHRVVPGFVVQFGDPGGDGYGGSGKLLRCETSPVAFDALDVGVALAGRDTGSSQLFVTLARYPHLEGEYTRVGRAEGDWAAVAEGDVIRDVKVEE